MLDGVVHVWNAALLLRQLQPDTSNHADDADHADDNDDAAAADDDMDALVYTLPTPSSNRPGPIAALAWSPLAPHNIALGTASGQAFTWSLATTSPTLQAASRHTAEITSVAWNSQVPHILATAAADGSVVVWDGKSAKAWCELRTPATCLAWNPTQGLHLLTTDGPAVHVWDLAASTSLPVATLPQHHLQSILQMAWCPHDDTLLVTTAKDGLTLLWDLRTYTCLAEVPNDANPALQQQQHQQQHHQQQSDSHNPALLFAASSTPPHVRYAVHWAPHTRGVLLTCRLDKHVQLQSLPPLPRPPAWLAPPCAVSTGFGGTLAHVGKGSSTVTLSYVPTDPRVVATIQATAHAAGQSPRDVCWQHAETAAASQSDEAILWGFLSVLFEGNARQALVQYLGYHADEIAQAVAELSDSKDNSNRHEDEDDATHLAQGMQGLSMTASSSVNRLVEKALVVGNFAAAVDACLAVENYADALLLASCGGGELWTATQERYFASQAATQQKPYLGMVQAIMQNQMSKLVQEADLAKWRETLAILSTYGASDEFPQLCQALGGKLQEAGDADSACLCYICAMDVPTVVAYWKEQLDGASPEEEDDWMPLHQFVVKVSILLQACPSELSPEVSALFNKYAQLLAEQGLLVEAAPYVYEGVLQDRLYRSRASQACLVAMGNQPPAFPYAVQTVEMSRGVVSLPQERDAAVVAAAQAEASAAARAVALAQQQQQQQEAAQQQAAAHQAAQTASSHQGANQQQQHPASNGHGGYQAAPASDELAPGWTALQDPGSGMTYYANQTTGETTWERPISHAPAPQLTPAPVAQGQSVGNTTPSKPKNTLASKYGDGFVSSASDPKLANQYGNVGTSNPYHGADRPGTAAAAVAGKQEAPVSSDLNVEEVQMSVDLQPFKDSLLQLLDAVKSTQLTSADKRQVADGEKAVTILVKNLSRGRLEGASLENAKTMVGALVSGEYRTATSLQTSLVHSDWREHKDWLKGMKSLIQLASRKLAPAQTQPHSY
jgi:protein transport protein SEC31